MEVRRLFETPAGARPWRPGSSLFRLAAAALAGAVILSGCALPVGDDAAQAQGGLPRELSDAPAPLEDHELKELEDLRVKRLKDGEKAGRKRKDKSAKNHPSGQGQADQGGSSDDPATGDNGGDGGGGGGSADPSPRPPPTTTLTTVQDPEADSGDGPRYGDVRTLTLSSSGASAIVAVDFDGRIPETLRQGEVMGIGVDLYSDPDDESDYQLFADGSSEGWFAYLQTPEGFVDYPGEFRLGGRRMVFEVDWSDLGRMQEGYVWAFADWSRRAQTTNDFSEDLAPDDDSRRFER